MRRSLTPLLALAALVLAALVFAVGCGSSTSSGSSAGDSASASAGGGYGSAAGTATTAPAAAPAATATVTTRGGRLGTLLTDARGRTLYRFMRDRGASSTCSGACAENWPPLMTTGRPKAAGRAKAASLGTTRRSNGKLQVTYAGHPLYSFVGDSAAGQTNGQGIDAFGAEWYVVAPSGKVIDSD